MESGGIHHRADLFIDPLQHFVQVQRRSDGDVNGVQRGEFLHAASGLFVETGALDGHCGLLSKEPQQPLVVGGECSLLSFLREGDDPNDLLLPPERYPDDGSERFFLVRRCPSFPMGVVIHGERLPCLHHATGDAFTEFKARAGKILLQIVGDYQFEFLARLIVEIQPSLVHIQQSGRPVTEIPQQVRQVGRHTDSQGGVVQHRHLIGPPFRLLKQAGVLDGDGGLLAKGQRQFSHLLGIETSLSLVGSGEADDLSLAQ